MALLRAGKVRLLLALALVAEKAGSPATIAAVRDSGAARRP
jgi:hypothetical protein